jgi:hypothetical protein
MFVASLNLDLFFKKVFSNKRVAKKFLEDLLSVKITEIELLTVDNKLTDDSVFVKFDFRCKIRGQYVVIEMQQQYKIDVIKRFYLYHSVSTALQLEVLKSVNYTRPNGEDYTEKNYSGLEPVITLIWMVDDMLGFDEDFIVYSTLPEVSKDFIKDDDLWAKPLDEILNARKKTLQILNNKTKGLDFFAQNKLIYIFQKNIVKNKRIDLPYFKWFDFAQMSRNRDNKEEDFAQYKKDKDMAEVINRLRKDKLSPDEFKYVSDAPMFELFWERMRQEHDAELKRRNKLEAAQSLKLEKAKAEKEKAEAEKEKEASRAESFENIFLEQIKAHLQEGGTIQSIPEKLKINIELASKLVALIQAGN